VGHGHRAARGTGLMLAWIRVVAVEMDMEIRGFMRSERAQGACSGREKRDLKPRIEGNKCTRRTTRLRGLGYARTRGS
jgi:hypothetical protein